MLVKIIMYRTSSDWNFPAPKKKISEKGFFKTNHARALSINRGIHIMKEDLWYPNALEVF